MYNVRMNRLSTEQRGRIVGCLVEGMSIRATVRVTGAAKNTVVKLLLDLGAACSEYQDGALQNLTCKRVEVDEIWAFVGAKQKNVKAHHPEEWGDAWTWVALDADTKLVPSWLVGPRNTSSAVTLMRDLASRLAHRIQLTTDGYRPYMVAVPDAFGEEIDFATLHKLYGNDPTLTEKRYSPASCIGTERHIITGEPDAEHISTKLHREAESHDADEHEALYPADQRLFAQGREPRRGGQPAFHALQLRARAQDSWRDPRHGRRSGGSRLDLPRNRGPARRTRHPKLTHYRRDN